MSDTAACMTVLYILARLSNGYNVCRRCSTGIA